MKFATTKLTNNDDWSRRVPMYTIYIYIYVYIRYLSTTAAAVYGSSVTPSPPSKWDKWYNQLEFKLW